MDVTLLTRGCFCGYPGVWLVGFSAMANLEGFEWKFSDFTSSMDIFNLMKKGLLYESWKDDVLEQDRMYSSRLK